MADEQAVQTIGDRSELTGIIRDIRKRWRLKLALRGAMFVIGGAILALLLSAYSLEHLRFSPGSIIAFRIAMVMVHYGGSKPGFVLAGRNLREVEGRARMLIMEVAAAWFVLCAATAVLTFMRRQKKPHELLAS